ncbi:protoporphyrinogen IX oxidase [Segetibacter sp. 3557_3]|uniref:CopD family protein n=1 Tax=Segetibacter sp. 3557_3 TaxID=2547429 RepID=UPI0010591611|nr:CopD family protein [Segetibacter sp. 3557_3]TDH26114.1 protoporphyrinogen IX oxidase [Segetibacter sp. 3557_3]
MLLYLKALHIIFIVTWFSGMFYIVRLFIYNAEAAQKTGVEREVLQKQYEIMIKRLWFGITWPSAVLTLIFGPLVMYTFGYFSPVPGWLWIKLAFVLLLYCYHYSLHLIYRQQMRGLFSISSQKLRVWNEVATIFLVAIVMLVVVKQNMSWAWGLGGLLLFVVLLMSAIKIYKSIRDKK